MSRGECRIQIQRCKQQQRRSSWRDAVVEISKVPFSHVSVCLLCRCRCRFLTASSAKPPHSCRHDSRAAAEARGREDSPFLLISTSSLSSDHCSRHALFALIPALRSAASPVHLPFSPTPSSSTYASHVAHEAQLSTLFPRVLVPHRLRFCPVAYGHVPCNLRSCPLLPPGPSVVGSSATREVIRSRMPYCHVTHFLHHVSVTRARIGNATARGYRDLGGSRICWEGIDASLSFGRNKAFTEWS